MPKMMEPDSSWMIPAMTRITAMECAHRSRPVGSGSGLVIWHQSLKLENRFAPRPAINRAVGGRSQRHGSTRDHG